MFTMLSPYLVKLITFDITLILFDFSGKVTTQIRCGEKKNYIFICKQFFTAVKERLKSVYSL